MLELTKETVDRFKSLFKSKIYCFEPVESSYASKKD